jgi:hypothetical protein
MSRPREANSLDGNASALHYANGGQKRSQLSWIKIVLWQGCGSRFLHPDRKERDAVLAAPGLVSADQGAEFRAHVFQLFSGNGGFASRFPRAPVETSLFTRSARTALGGVPPISTSKG